MNKNVCTKEQCYQTAKCTTLNTLGNNLEIYAHSSATQPSREVHLHGSNGRKELCCKSTIIFCSTGLYEKGSIHRYEGKKVVYTGMKGDYTSTYKI